MFGAVILIGKRREVELVQDETAVMRILVKHRLDCFKCLSVFEPSGQPEYSIKLTRPNGQFCAFLV